MEQHAVIEQSATTTAGMRCIELPSDIFDLAEQNARLAKDLGILGYDADMVTLIRRLIPLPCA